MVGQSVSCRVGWGGSCWGEVGYAGMQWVMQGWGGS